MGGGTPGVYGNSHKLWGISGICNIILHTRTAVSITTPTSLRLCLSPPQDPNAGDEFGDGSQSLHCIYGCDDIFVVFRTSRSRFLLNQSSLNLSLSFSDVFTHIRYSSPRAHLLSKFTCFTTWPLRAILQPHPLVHAFTDSLTHTYSR